MNISGRERKLINNSNIYNACNGDYHVKRNINRKYIVENRDSINHKLVKTPQGIKLIIDKSSSDLDQVFQKYGRSIPPDEILEMMKPGNLKIPIVEDPLLPNSDLLNSIHYYLSKKYSHEELTSANKRLKRSKTKSADGGRKALRYDKYLESMDESSLIFMGMLIESWCDELITDEVCKMYLERDPALSDDDKDEKLQEHGTDSECEVEDDYTNEIEDDKISS
ncbi:uncharacterized protein KGF55_003638 [Candida pseudojiufengensis]|uniref:uncharacterized protein n=1 Tax=Candida pseudojiufengensis TaxID=497109 RepID=UPI0022257BBD|nr:uncharacterized protein KGF55_003638 [Candida pseudojiufengensis]KAI5962562.1 hypothetical protein KGF55_003638 [Candida pseudojiufengensis]